MPQIRGINLAEIYGNIDNARANQAQLENQRLQQQQMQYEIGRQRQQDQRQDQVRGVYSGAVENVNGTPTLNEKRLLSDLYRVDPETALSTQEKFTQRDATKAKTQLETQKAELANKVEQSKYLRDRLASVRDQSSYDAVMQEAADMGAGIVKSAPREFNPQWVEQNLYGADEFIKKGEAELNRGITMRGQDITLRGQDLTDARTRSEGAANRGVSIRGQNMTNQRALEKNSLDAAAGGYSNKPLPATALKMQQEGLEKLSIASNNNDKLGKVVSQIDAGELKLGLLSNIEGNLRNKAGLSNESSQNLSSFKSTIEKLRNDSLRLNTGVQTDGDAQRAWNELFENINDQSLVRKRLKEIQEINKRGAELQKLQVENIRGNYNAPPVDFGKYEVNSSQAIQTGEPIMTRSQSQMPAQKAPKIGTVQDGYVFKGGNPADQNNWKRK